MISQVCISPHFFFVFSRWLLGDPDMVVRSMYPPFLRAVERYFDALSSIVSPEQVKYDRTHQTDLCFAICIFSQVVFTTSSILMRNLFFSVSIKGEVRTINDGNICKRRRCMKNNGKSPTFKFISGEERRLSEVQRVSRGWRFPGAMHSSADLTWIRKMTGNSGSRAVRAGKR